MYCEKLHEIHMQQLELNKTIQMLKAELDIMSESNSIVDQHMVENYTYNPPDAGMQK